MDGLLIIPILAFLILVHELGHYWAARSCGVKVEEFGIGIPPRAKGWERNGVIWSLNWIPFGGFVRVKGEDAGDMSPDSMNAKPPLQRAFFLLAGSMMNIITALVLIIVLVGFVGETQDRVYVNTVVPNAPAAQAGILPDDRIVRANGTVIDDSATLTSIINDNRGENVTLDLARGTQELSVNVVPREDPPAGEGATGVGLTPITEASIDIGSLTAGGVLSAAGFQDGDRVTAVNGVPMTDSVIFSRTVLLSQGQTMTVTVDRDGETIDLPVAIPLSGINVTQATIEGPAYAAGIRPGDRLLSLNGQPLVDAESFGQALLAARGTDAAVTIARPDASGTVAEQQLTLAIPQFDDRADYLSTIGIEASEPSVENLLGATIDLEPIYRDIPALEVIPTGLANAWDQTVQMVDGLRQLFTGQIPLDTITGPVGMGQATSELLDLTAEPAWVAVTRLMILISLNLAILNLLPLPALDGGRLLFVIIEMVRGGRKIAPEKEGVVHFAGLVVLLLVMFAVAFNDIRRIVEGTPIF